MASARRYTTGEVSELTGLTRRTLHFYEEMGLVKPCERSEGKQRLYASEQVRQLSYIASLKSIGVPLKKIRELMDLRRKHEGNPHEAASEMAGFMNEMLPRIREQIEALSKLRDDFTVGKEMLRVCRTCPKDAGAEECRQCDVINDRESLPGVIREFWLSI